MHKKRIGIMMQGDRQWAGGVEYTRNLIAAVDRLPESDRAGVELHLILRGDIESSLYADLTDRVAGVHSVGTGRFAAFSELMKLSLDFLYPYARHTWMMPKLKGAAWIPDFQHKHLGDLFTPSELAARERSFSGIARFSPRVVFSSEAARQEFHRWYPNAHARADVLRFATSLPSGLLEEDPVDVQKRYHLPDRFFICSNQFWAHKNHKLILEALVALGKQGIAPPIVFTGHPYDRRRPGFIDDILSFIHMQGLAKQVFLLGLIPRRHQMQLLRRSLAVIQPSLYEGWSTVVEDAKSLGKPVLVSDLQVHIEQNATDGIVFPRNDSAALARHIAQQWETLSPGPHATAEREASIRTQTAVQKFGRTFLRIASSD